MAHRSNYLETDDEYFMEFACVAARRSKDPETQVGACIVNEDKVVVGIGYNHMPKESDEFSWERKKENPSNNKHMFVIHAEMAAIIKKTIADLHGCTIYVTLFPCNECAKVIVESGIKEVVYLSDAYAKKDYTKIAKGIFNTVRLRYRACGEKLPEPAHQEENSTKKRKL
ncbi:unnamed protein product [Diabrotica balteata]|uniref:Probable deoxycytidylate deaminase n=1 Tax=Diabrotica balteata TaxID=107213 RepID=A0A9N9T3Z4_DIABA|nr:unnamed protein product [Diabrotica balteata]